jgi:hypothetical protein
MSELERSRHQGGQGNQGRKLFKSIRNTLSPAEITPEEANNECLRLENKIELLERELEDEKLNRSRVERRVDNLQRHIDNTKPLLGPQDSDDTIIVEFKELMRKIRTWSLKFTADVPSPLNIEPSQDELDIYRQVNTTCRTREGLLAVLHDGKKRRFFASGLVAYVISNSILLSRDSPSPPPRILEPRYEQDFWLEGPWRNYVAFLEQILHTSGSKIGDRELNDWRALTVELLTKAAGGNVTLPEDTRVYLALLETFVMRLMAPWAASDDTFRNLSNILKDAVKFSHRLRRQRPCWSVRFPEEIAEGNITLFYDPHTMLDPKIDDKKGGLAEVRDLPVQFVVCPQLLKRGTLEGDQFNRESIVMKAEVVVEQKEAR